MKLCELIEQYVTFRAALGERCVTNGRILRAFGRAVGTAADIAEVGGEQVSAFLAGSGPITSTWHVKHNALVGFYRYATSRDYVSLAPLPAVVPKRPPHFAPHIYSLGELRRILDATGSYQRNRSSTEPITIRIIVLLLYGTGLRIREAINLNRSDVDLDDSLLTVRHTKFYKSRFVPFGSQLRESLRSYATRDGVPEFATDGDPPFITTRKGKRMNRDTVEHCFRRVCNHAGVQRTDGARYQPRLHDLRHTFAVHRVTSWYRQGMDVQKLLPHLSVYMGHVHLAATQVYLSMTPELLHEASIRFEQYAEDRGES